MKKVLLSVFLITGLIIPQNIDFMKSIEYERSAIKYYQDKKYDSMLVQQKSAEKLRPNHPRIIYNLAAAYNLNDQPFKSLNELNKLMKMHLFFQPEKDSDFVSLWGEVEFKEIVEGFHQNLKPAGNSKTAFTFPEKDLLTESVAYDPSQNKFYLSSVYKSKIVTIDNKGNTGIFKSEREDSLWSVFGIKTDPQRRLLWVCAGAVEQAKNYNKKISGRSAVYKYDIDSKKLLNKYEPDDSDNHLFGDLTLSENGDVYISDSRYNAIYIIEKQKDSLRIFAEPGEFVSLQGLDISADQRFLFIADYALGLFRIDLKTRKTKQLDPPSDVTLLGVDGLYFYKNSLIATQNGVNPQRVFRLFLNEDFNEIETAEILEANNPYFDEITLGFIKEDEFYYIANSQWGNFDKHGIISSKELKEPRVLKIILDH